MFVNKYLFIHIMFKLAIFQKNEKTKFYQF